MNPAKPLLASVLAQRIGASLRGDADPLIRACATLEDAGPEDLSFLANPRYGRQLRETRAGAVVIAPRDLVAAGSRTLLVHPDPYYAFRNAVVELHGFATRPPAGISSLAFVHPEASLGEGCAVAPFAHVEAGARIGARTSLGPHVCIGPNAVIGEDCLLHAHVVVYEGCTLGSRVTLHAGCVIGQDGFGYATHGEPGQPPTHHKFPQTGVVVVEDDVEMGANCAIDRAALGVTRIGRGTKFSNLVTVGHGSQVGRHNLVRTGDHVVIGGQAGIAGHLRVADRVRIAARAGVMDNLDQAGETYGGEPAMPFTRFKRAALSMLKLPELLEEVRELRQRVKELEAKEQERQPPAGA